MSTLDDKLKEIEGGATCVTCGSPVLIEGTVTRYYVQRTLDLIAMLRKCREQRDFCIEAWGKADIHVDEHFERTEYDAELLKLAGGGSDE
jgi:hypothetical protein